MNELLHAAVVNLLDKLDEVSDATLGIFSLAQIHGAKYTGPTYKVEYDLLRTLTSVANITTPNPKDVDWDKWERDGCIGCEYDVGDVRIIWFDKQCPIHGHNSAWKNLELRSDDECNGVCVINPNDIVWFDSDCSVHHSLSDGRSIAETFHTERHGKPTPEEEKWLNLVEGEREKMEEKLREDTEWLDGLEVNVSEEFLELAEADWARAMTARFDALRGPIKELAELEKEHQVHFRPSKEWLERMFKIEDECGGHISVGGLAADLGMLPENPENVFLMMGSGGEPMRTMSNPSLDDLVYYMRADESSVRLLSTREANLADRCNSLDECPAEDPDIVECPMHPELGG